MFEPPTTAYIAGIESFLLAAVLLTLGFLLVDAVSKGYDVDCITRWGLALPGFLAYALVLMVAHIASRGAVLSNLWLVRCLTLSVLTLLVIRKVRARRSGERRGQTTRAAALLIALTVLSVALWCIPVFQLLPIDVAGDNNQHMGWAAQLMNGEPTPSVGLTGTVPNSYPWLYHAATAVIADSIPGGRTYHTQGTWQLLQVVGMVLALFALGRQLTGHLTTGFAAALFGAMTGGFGFFLVDKVDLVLRPRREGGTEALRYLGDLLNARSYNIAFHNLAPAFPRDVNYSLLCAFLLTLVLGLSRRNMPILIGSGVILGMMGLVGAESFFVALGIAIVAILVRGGVPRLRTAMAILVPALLLYSLWLAPALASFLRLGGYKNTAYALVELPPLAILFSWGVVTPLAVIGVLLWVTKMRSHTGATVLGACAASSAAATFGAPIISGMVGPGFATLGFQHRYWPLLYLACGLYAAIAFTFVFESLLAKRPGLATGLVLGVIGLAIPSPLIGTLSLPHTLGSTGPLRPLLEESLRGEGNTLLNQLALDLPSRRCTVAAPIDLTVRTFSYTGFRHVMYSRTRRINAFVRYRDIYQHIVPKEERIKDSTLLTNGMTDARTWNALVARYHVNSVIVEEGRADSEVYTQLPKRGPTEPVEGVRYYIMLTDVCAR
ncbi:MAG: hypothetical protein M3454_05050 [Actinomycetota bacterium]|nr:hypothetical protein [Actinomycetota bacterium]